MYTAVHTASGSNLCHLRLWMCLLRYWVPGKKTVYSYSNEQFTRKTKLVLGQGLVFPLKLNNFMTPSWRSRFGGALLGLLSGTLTSSCQFNVYLTDPALCPVVSYHAVSSCERIERDGTSPKPILYAIPSNCCVSKKKNLALLRTDGQCHSLPEKQSCQSQNCISL